jgi:hypothetical protein
MEEYVSVSLNTVNEMHQNHGIKKEFLSVCYNCGL